MENNRYRISLIISALILLSFFIISGASAEAQQCTPLLAKLMPRDTVNVTCQYNSSGIIGLGFGAGNLPFEHPCSNQTTKYPGHITFDVKHYSGDGLAIFRMQIGPEEQQRIANKKAEFEKKSRKNSGASLKTEKLGGGTVIYTEQFIDCSEGVKRSKPSVNLLAVAHTDSTAINIEIDGFISADAAKAAALEVLANFRKMNFDAAGRSM